MEHGREPLAHGVTGLTFGFYEAEEVRKLSAVCVQNPYLFDSMNNSARGGLYDGRMGPVDRAGKCETCGLGYAQCPGHLGHLELCVPVYNPMVMDKLLGVVRLLCLGCHRIRVNRDKLVELAGLEGRAGEEGEGREAAAAAAESEENEGREDEDDGEGWGEGRGEFAVRWRTCFEDAWRGHAKAKCAECG